MKFTLFNIKFKISFIALSVIYIMLLFDKTGYSYKMVLSIFSHEIGHIIAMLLLGAKIKEINLILGTLQIKRDLCKSSFEEIIISIFGPFFNLIFFLLFLKIDLEFSLINLIYFLINLIPITSFDGGDILKIILEKFLSFSAINIIIKIITLLLCIGLLILSIKLFIAKNLNISLFIMTFYLFISLFIK